METAYDRIARTRPRLRRDVLFTAAPDGVLFHNTQGGFHVRGADAYRFAVLLVPHLDGTTEVARLCAGLGEPQRAMVANVVDLLYERGFARDVPEGADDSGARLLTEPVARRFAAQIGYVDHYAHHAHERFRRFRDTRVVVLGGDEVARWCALSLVRNGNSRVHVLSTWFAEEAAWDEVRTEAGEVAESGCPVAFARTRVERAPKWTDLADYDVVVTTDVAVAHALSTEGVPEGQAFVPAWVFGDRQVIGPLEVAGRAGCWTCAALRLGAGSTGAAADLWSAVATGTTAPGARPDRPLAAMVGNLLGYEVFRLRTQALPAETDGQVVVQDTATLDVATEPLLPHPRCPRCAQTAEPAPDLTVSLLTTRPIPPAVTARDADDLVAELNDRMRLVQPNAGVVTAFADESHTQNPLKVATVVLPLGHGAPRRVTAFDPHHLAGARLRVLDAAGAVYVDHVAAPPPAARAEGAAVGLGGLDTATGLPGEVTGWTAAVSLLTKETVLVPTAAAHPFGPANHDRLVEPTSAGVGAGRSPAEAAGRGLLSALGFRALRGALRGTAAVLRVRVPEDGASPELTFLLRAVDLLDADLELLDLAPDGAVPVLFARARAADGEPVWAVAADLSWDAAAVRALCDVLGQVQLKAETGAPVDLGDPLVADLAPETVAVDGEADAPVTSATTWAALHDGLRARGVDPLLVPRPAPDLAAGGVHVARVLLTGGATGG
ncbi:TOMM precursor leader peptide-binding protein [Actinokineospora auranticolor]|uniref:Bacteriocin biosynthesis cyclodehydratase domain-containing protein n=1 Tax=Actinokineospora auranticolor TaxID=155976 RepID=A0A2S6GET1_9PSEU|nr:TOMM precursor leader peptide-binding protein [Actinokineospora auranticolor]PPK63723.1 bacteriocin biosynthesis cyclodehydratase domain-containing protein [Actinokineospora auranticolor]